MCLFVCYTYPEDAPAHVEHGQVLGVRRERAGHHLDRLLELARLVKRVAEVDGRLHVAGVAQHRLA
eukprot:5417773-Pyramimonas_sp.AAC.1